VVLDASAMLAVLRREPGADVVVPHLRGARMSTVNCAEVLQKSSEIGASAKALLRIMEDLEVQVVDFSLGHATACAALLEPTRSLGLSLGDRACLALGMAEEALVLTADRRWNHPAVTARMKFIR
jgi:PIN domain nuclease of toxin-antitoxin system